MPLSDNEQLNKVSGEIVSTLRGAFSTPNSHRPGHAKGILTKGTFIPSSTASQLSTAPHFSHSVPVLARFSDSGGNPHIADTSPQANPQGLGLRFVLSPDGHKHTDLIGHSTPFFPAKDGNGFLAFVQAAGSGKVEEYLAAHEEAKNFVTAPKPWPESFATQEFFFISAHVLVDASGKKTAVRMRVEPELSHKVLVEEGVAKKGDNYLFEEIDERLAKEKVGFVLKAQIAEEGDITNDNTKHWPEDRKVVELGRIELEKVVGGEEGAEEMRKFILDPYPRVEGVEASDDPLFEWRASVYLQSGKIRRAAASA